MHTFTYHPLTGAGINVITVQRTSLDAKDAVTAWILKLQGRKIHDIAAELGTNVARLYEVFRGEKYPEAKHQALALLGLI